MIGYESVSDINKPKLKRAIQIEHLKDLNDIVNYLPYSVVDYNNKPHGGLYGLVPNESLDGNVSVKNKLKIDSAKTSKLNFK